MLHNIKFHVFLACVIKGLWNKESSLLLKHNLPTTQNIETVKINILNTPVSRIVFNVPIHKIALYNLDSRVKKLKSNASSLNLTSYYTCVYELTEGKWVCGLSCPTLGWSYLPQRILRG
jgi:hypothetical protein